MRAGIASLCQNLAGLFGYRFEKLERSKLRCEIPQGSRLHVGCGEQDLPGYFGCDIRALPHVQLVCKAWEVSQFTSGLEEIFSRHMVEHLTIAEARLTLRDWYRALAPNGKLRIEVPNIDFHIAQWQRAKWNQEELDINFSRARWGLAGFYGWQRECDPESADYNTLYWDVHKSGYSPESLRFFLNEAGFDAVEIKLEGFSAEQCERLKVPLHDASHCHLVAEARKRENAELAA